MPLIGDNISSVTLYKSSCQIPLDRITHFSDTLDSLHGSINYITSIAANNAFQLINIGLSRSHPQIFLVDNQHHFLIRYVLSYLEILSSQLCAAICYHHDQIRFFYFILGALDTNLLYHIISISDTGSIDHNNRISANRRTLLNGISGSSGYIGNDSPVFAEKPIQEG